MPLYEYACPHCGNRFEELMRVNDPAPACPKCGKTGAKRAVSAPAAAPLTGSGPGAVSGGCAGRGAFS